MIPPREREARLLYDLDLDYGIRHEMKFLYLGKKDYEHKA